VCSQLIGRKYEYGSSDCINLVFDALDILGIDNPGVQADWYNMSPKQVLGELEFYCDRLVSPSYDGDMVLLNVRPMAFGVLWQRGILYINNLLSAVDWKPVGNFSIRRSYRMKNR
jgi:hypothetical protein